MDWMMDFESGKQEADNAPANEELENDPMDIDSLIDEGLVNLPATGEEPECPPVSSMQEAISAPEPDLPYAPVDTGNEDAIVMATAEVENQ